MYLSSNWLKDFISLPSSVSMKDVADKLTLHTVEVEGIVDQAEKFNKLAVGKILEIKKHPNADRLQIAKVDIGKNKLNIVCGASNIEVGQLVPVALEGAVLSNGLEIKKTEVRGEFSEGMLCAPDEIGMGEDHSGILILDERAQIGQSLSEYFNIKDVILEVDNKSLSNRPDLLNHYGIAREVAAIFSIKLKKQEEDKLKKILKKNNYPTGKEKLKINVKNEKLCPRYMGIKINNIEIKASPKWIQNRLIAVGMRPINNIVDITNYVMLELGQPMHAFDAELIKEIVVRTAGKGEIIETLDGQKRELDKNMLVIADSKKAIAIAGVMGGRTSEVSDETKNIILESANFEAFQTRKTSNALNLRTEASARFEKSLDPNLCETALARALELILESCPKAKIASELVDEKKFNINQGPINFDMAWFEKIIGQKIEEKIIKNILKALGFEILEEKNNSLKIKVPTWRATRDVSLPEDVAEEIARIYGFDKIKTTSPIVKLEALKDNIELFNERKIKEVLSKSARLNEVYNYSFVGEELLKKLNVNFSSHLKLANPLSRNHTMLRQSLAPNLIENVKANESRFDKIALFEIGSVFYDLPSNINKDNKTKESLPFQEKRLGILLSSNDDKKLLRQFKGKIELLMKSFNLDVVYEKRDDFLGWENQESLAKIIVNNKEVGYLTMVDQKVLNNLNIKTKIALAEINLDLFIKIISNDHQKKYLETPKYPAVIRDLAFVVRDKILYNDIKKEIEAFNRLIFSVELFDVYQGIKLGQDKKSLAFHIQYLAHDRTLTNEEVDIIQKELVEHLEKKYEAQIRNF